jgi:predicted transcriptional regulator
MSLMMITLKIDPRMKQALENVAKKEFSTVSGIIKKSVQEYMEKQGIDWEKGTAQNEKIILTERLP